jgi:hypothetical protein
LPCISLTADPKREALKALRHVARSRRERLAVQIPTRAPLGTQFAEGLPQHLACLCPLAAGQGQALEPAHAARPGGLPVHARRRARPSSQYVSKTTGDLNGRYAHRVLSLVDKVIRFDAARSRQGTQCRRRSPIELALRGLPTFRWVNLRELKALGSIGRRYEGRWESEAGTQSVSAFIPSQCAVGAKTEAL